MQLTSFLLGIGVALAVPLFSRVLRPLAVEAAAAGMGLFEEGRRVLAEQVELIEDIAAEARARREIIVAGANGAHHTMTNGADPTGAEINGAESDAEPVAAAPGRGRRRGNSVRRQPS
jgi:hypothetical protein